MFYSILNFSNWISAIFSLISTGHRRMISLSPFNVSIAGLHPVNGKELSYEMGEFKILQSSSQHPSFTKRTDVDKLSDEVRYPFPDTMTNPFGPPTGVQI